MKETLRYLFLFYLDSLMHISKEHTKFEISNEFL